MAATIYYINCLTNLHVGSGDVNFNTIDNEVERDPVTGYPTIHASGIKGALRQFFVENVKDAALTIRFFGSSVQNSKKEADATDQEQSSTTDEESSAISEEVDATTGEEEDSAAGEDASASSKDKTVQLSKKAGSIPGSLKFLTAQMLGRPARASQGRQAYYMVTTKLALEQLCTIGKALGCMPSFNPQDLSATINYRSPQELVAVEGYPVNKALPNSGDFIGISNYLRRRFKEDFLILSDETFRKLPLPVLARNQLENGESKQLWYEEYVPHKSIFWFAVIGSAEDLKEFDDKVKDKLIQFGGNASIGCGLCIVTKGESTNV